jgi:hypothetical protein
MVAVLSLGAGISVALAGLAYLRTLRPALVLPCTLSMLGLIVAAFFALVVLGKRHGWAPTRAAIRQLLLSAKARLLPARTERSAHGL